MQIAKYEVSFSGQTYTPNEFKASHNLISIETNQYQGLKADFVRLLFGGGSHFQADLNDEISVKLGDEDGLQDVFQGKITHISFLAKYIVVEARKPNYLLFFTHFHQLIQEQSAGEIVKIILAKAKVPSAKLENGITFDYYPIHESECGYVYIDRLAKQNGFFHFCDTKSKFHFLKPQIASAKESFYYGDILDISYENQYLAYEKFVVYGESAASKKGKETTHWLHSKYEDYKGSEGKEKSFAMTDYSLRNQQNATTVAKNSLKNAQNNKIKGHIKVLGSAHIQVGNSISLSQTPVSGLNSTFYVVEVQHVFNHTEGFISNISFLQV